MLQGLKKNIWLSLAGVGFVIFNAAWMYSI